jgi:hypothetical protein
MATYNRIPLALGTGKALLEYSGNQCRLTVTLRNISGGKACKPYLLWEDRFVALSESLSNGKSTLRSALEVENPQDIRAVALITDALEPVAIGYVNGEYDWHKCFMSNLAPIEDEQEQEQETDTKPPSTEDATDTKQAFKSVVCHLSDDLRELKRYTQMQSCDTASALFSSHDAVTPFYGCTGKWIQINLKELAQVASLWKYLNNPMVRYSCKHYHHLILGCDGAVLTLGIPWEYDASYRLEAEIQGFNAVKPVKNVAPQKGDMCYLLMNL